MDSASEYIRMCEKAWPYLTTAFDYRDIVYSPSRQALCKTSYKQDYATGDLKPVFVRLQGTEFVEADDFFIVWQLRQLRDMIAESGITYSQYQTLRDSSPFLRYLPKETDGNLLENGLLLAVILYEHHGKAWTGQDWVDVKKR